MFFAFLFMYTNRAKSAPRDNTELVRQLWAQCHQVPFLLYKDGEKSPRDIKPADLVKFPKRRLVLKMIKKWRPQAFCFALSYKKI